MYLCFLIFKFWVLLQGGKEQGGGDEAVYLNLQIEKCEIGQFRKLTYWASFPLTTLFIIRLAKKSV